MREMVSFSCYAVFLGSIIGVGYVSVFATWW